MSDSDSDDASSSSSRSEGNSGSDSDSDSNAESAASKSSKGSAQGDSSSDEGSDEESSESDADGAEPVPPDDPEPPQEDNVPLEPEPEPEPTVTPEPDLPPPEPAYDDAGGYTPKRGPYIPYPKEKVPIAEMDPQQLLRSVQRLHSHRPRTPTLSGSVAESVRLAKSKIDLSVARLYAGGAGRLMALRLLNEARTGVSDPEVASAIAAAAPHVVEDFVKSFYEVDGGSKIRKMYTTEKLLRTPATKKGLTKGQARRQADRLHHGLAGDVNGTSSRPATSPAGLPSPYKRVFDPSLTAHIGNSGFAMPASPAAPILPPIEPSRASTASAREIEGSPSPSVRSAKSKSSHPGSQAGSEAFSSRSRKSQRSARSGTSAASRSTKDDQSRRSSRSGSVGSSSAGSNSDTD